MRGLLRFPRCGALFRKTQTLVEWHAWYRGIHECVVDLEDFEHALTEAEHRVRLVCDKLDFCGRQHH